MTRINTNVSSLNAQKSLARSNAQLQESLTRLSTGLRINSGKDDPAGLIASEMLRSDMTSTERAITNSERANQMIATADSALGQVSSLLNDIRGLVSEAANTGAISAEQVTANQLQVDSSLVAIDRIAQVTQFQGKRLLDGSLDFITEDVDATKVSNLAINQANFGTLDEIGVSVDVIAQATKGQLSYASNSLSGNTVLEIGGANGFEAFNFAAGSTVAQMADAINLVSDALGVEASIASRVAETATNGQVTFANLGGAAADSFSITAAADGQYAGNITVRMTKAAAGDATTASWSAGSPNVIDVTVGTQAAATAGTFAGGPLALGGVGTLTSLTPQLAGKEYNNAKIEIIDGGAGATLGAKYDYANKTIEVTMVSGSLTMANAVLAINNDLGNLFAAVAGGAGSVVAGLYTNGGSGFTTGTGRTAGVVTGDVQDIRDAIFALTQVTVSANTSSAIADIITHSGAIGEVNASETATGEPNNRIQLTTSGGAANMDVQFRASGVSQAFGIEFTNNTRTDGKAITYLRDAAGTGVLKVQAVGQGTAWNGVTVVVTNHASRKNATYDAATKTLTVYGAVTAGTDTTQDLADRINATGLFTATAPVDGTIATATSNTTADGAIYDSVVVNLATDANGLATSTAAEVVNAMNASVALQSIGVTASHVFSSDGSGVAATGTLSMVQQGVTATNAYATGTTYAANQTDGGITVTARVAGAAYDNVKIVFEDDSTVTAGSNEFATYDAAQKILTFHFDDTGGSTAANVVANFLTGSGTDQSVKDLFTVANAGTGASAVKESDVGWLRNGVTHSGTSLGGLDSEGNFDAGQVVGTGGLDIKSTQYGSSAFVSVKALSGTFATTNSAGVAANRSSGTDINARINGIVAIGDGLSASINTSSLDVSFTIAAAMAAGSSTSFAITAGGAQFQLGPDVVSNQQARLGIQSVNTSKLGGDSGQLYQLRSGGVASLSTDTRTAANIVDDAIVSVTMLRGRLGAFQKTTLETNIAALSDTLEALTDAESSIRDADFAAESAALTRAQILVQSGTSVLAMANQNPQNVLALLR
ncbi:MAG: flagellin [Planctomycetia bacterium]|nr:flagellin [Planctomycetia bacterium]